ncbi:MAG: class I SAM-dependent methyltransferase [ANME-2 cluster archaeon]|nr:class I SAM-dependent methyltransferase [ANME-2 cluster archaeon]
MSDLLLHQVLGLDDDENLFIPEEGYSSLGDLYQTLGFMEQIAQSGGVDGEVRVVRDESGDTICLAINNPGTEEYPSFWAVFTNMVAKSGIQSAAAVQFDILVSHLLQSFDDITSLEVSAHELEVALREYYSIALVERQLCDGCVKPAETYEMVYLDIRVQRLDELFRKLGDRFNASGRVLEICCGNGMATLSLEKLGIFLLTTDHDRCQICQGLEHEVLKPERTIVMDATRLSDFFNEGLFDAVIGFMLGTIYSFNKDIWAAMMAESLKVVKPGGTLLFTVNKREEMDILKDALDGLGAMGEIIDNTDKNGIYDQWVYLGRKQQ